MTWLLPIAVSGVALLHYSRGGRPRAKSAIRTVSAERLDSTLLGHSASHSQRLFLPRTCPSRCGQRMGGLGGDLPFPMCPTAHAHVVKPELRTSATKIARRMFGSSCFARRGPKARGYGSPCSGLRQWGV